MFIWQPYMFNSVVASGPGYCSAITDQEERCRLLTEAAKPFVDVMISDPHIVSSLEMALKYAIMFLDLRLGSPPDFRGFLNELICWIASMLSYLRLLNYLSTVYWIDGKNIGKAMKRVTWLLEIIFIIKSLILKSCMTSGQGLLKLHPGVIVHSVFIGASQAWLACVTLYLAIIYNVKLIKFENIHVTLEDALYKWQYIYTPPLPYRYVNSDSYSCFL